MCMHTCMYVCMHAHGCMHVCMYACRHAGMHVCMHVCAACAWHTCVRVHIALVIGGLSIVREHILYENTFYLCARAHLLLLRRRDWRSVCLMFCLTCMPYVCLLCVLHVHVCRICGLRVPYVCLACASLRLKVCVPYVFALCVCVICALYMPSAHILFPVLGGA